MKHDVIIRNTLFLRERDTLRGTSFICKFRFGCNFYFVEGVGGAKMGNCMGRNYENMWVEIEAMVLFVYFVLCYYY